MLAAFGNSNQVHFNLNNCCLTIRAIVVAFSSLGYRCKVFYFSSFCVVLFHSPKAQGKKLFIQLRFAKTICKSQKHSFSLELNNGDGYLVENKRSRYLQTQSSAKLKKV